MPSYNRVVHRIMLVGCGRVVRERILPAIELLAQEGVLTVLHVIDAVPREHVAAALDKLLPVPPVYHRIGIATGDLARLLQTDELRAVPALVATPTQLHAEHACAALAAGCPVALEKPLTASASDLTELEACLARHEGRVVFPLGYYLIEKGLPLLALARSGALTPTQLSCLEGINPDTWRELRSGLGAVHSITAALREGPDPRAWVLSGEAGGHTLETFSHLVAMALPWFENLTLKYAVLGTAQGAPSNSSETVIFAELQGPKHETVRLGCEKWCPDSARARWVTIEFEHGSAAMDLEHERLTVRLHDRQYTSCVVRRAKYEPQLRMFAAKLNDPSEPTEFDIGRRSVLLSLAVRSVSASNPIPILPSSWLDDRLK